MKKVILSTLLAGVVSLNMTSTVEACSWVPRPPTFWAMSYHLITPHIKIWRYVIRLHGLVTVPMPVASPNALIQTCCMAFNLPPEIGKVTSVRVLHADTDKPVAGFNFRSNNATAKGFSELFLDKILTPDPDGNETRLFSYPTMANFQGFASSIASPIPGDVSVDFELEVESGERQSSEELLAAVAAHMRTGVPVLGIGPGNANGEPVEDEEHPGHRVILPVPEGEVTPECHATYSVETGKFHAPCVDVDVFDLPYPLAFDVKMQALPSDAALFLQVMEAIPMDDM